MEETEESEEEDDVEEEEDDVEELFGDNERVEGDNVVELSGGDEDVEGNDSVEEEFTSGNEEGDEVVVDEEIFMNDRGERGEYEDREEDDADVKGSEKFGVGKGLYDVEELSDNVEEESFSVDDGISNEGKPFDALGVGKTVVVVVVVLGGLTFVLE